MAVWAVTGRGAAVAEKIARELSATVFVSANVRTPPAEAHFFPRLAGAVAREFANYRAHVFVMATGIAVRVVAPHLASKTRDPAVVVVDDQGRFAISLVSGHTGGANRLAEEVAGVLGATAVVTTATDGAGVPAVDDLAARLGFPLENARAVKPVSMALLEGGGVWRYDPYGALDEPLCEWTRSVSEVPETGPGIYVHHEVRNLARDVVVLRPATLAVGMGCNSGTEEAELKDVLLSVLERHKLSPASIRLVATIEDKVFEPGLDALARSLDRPLEGFSRELLAAITDVPNPSAVVARHMGVPSVCEAAAIMGANRGELLVEKVKSGNVTVAVAALPFTWSAPAREDPHTCHCGHGK